MCPLKILGALARNNLLGETQIFPGSRFSARKLTAYMRTFTNENTFYTTHSLRIGGHTFYSIQNMNDDFIQFLGRRAIARASQLYYRANAVDNINRLRAFFAQIDGIPPFMKGLYGASM